MSWERFGGSTRSHRAAGCADHVRRGREAVLHGQAARRQAAARAQFAQATAAGRATCRPTAKLNRRSSNSWRISRATSYASPLRHARAAIEAMAACRLHAETHRLGRNRTRPRRAATSTSTSSRPSPKRSSSTCERLGWTFEVRHVSIMKQGKSARVHAHRGARRLHAGSDHLPAARATDPSPQQHGRQTHRSSSRERGPCALRARAPGGVGSATWTPAPPRRWRRSWSRKRIARIPRRPDWQARWCSSTEGAAAIETAMTPQN